MRRNFCAKLLSALFLIIFFIPNSKAEPTNSQTEICATPIKSSVSNYEYFQSYACSTLPKDVANLKRYKFETPFGPVTIQFRYIKGQNRFNRFVPNGGTYAQLTREIAKKYPIIKAQHALIEKILNELRSPVQNRCVWQETSVSTSPATPEAKLYAVLCVCDPCYGKGEDGGKNVRTMLRKFNELDYSNSSIKIFADPEFNPLAQRGAYKRQRYIVENPDSPKYPSFRLLYSQRSPHKAQPISSPVAGKRPRKLAQRRNLNVRTFNRLLALVDSDSDSDSDISISDDEFSYCTEDCDIMSDSSEFGQEYEIEPDFYM